MKAQKTPSFLVNSSSTHDHYKGCATFPRPRCYIVPSSFWSCFMQWFYTRQLLSSVNIKAILMCVRFAFPKRNSQTRPTMTSALFWSWTGAGGDRHSIVLQCYVRQGSASKTLSRVKATGGLKPPHVCGFQPHSKF